MVSNEKNKHSTTMHIHNANTITQKYRNAILEEM